MEYRQDIMMDLDDTEKRWDLAIKEGDFVVGVSDIQHIAHIILADKGQFRRTPFVGVGVLKMLNGPVSGQERREINLQLQSDGYKPKEVLFQEGMLKVRI